MIYQMNVSLDDWGEGVATAVHLINRTPTSALNGFTPEGLWIGDPAVRLKSLVVLLTDIYLGNLGIS